MGAQVKAALARARSKTCRHFGRSRRVRSVLECARVSAALARPRPTVRRQAEKSPFFAFLIWPAKMIDRKREPSGQVGCASDPLAAQGVAMKNTAQAPGAKNTSAM